MTTSLKNQFALVQTQVQDAVAIAVKAAASEIASRARQAMAGTQTETVVGKDGQPKPGAAEQVSVPGDPPAIGKGALADSIQVETVNDGQAQVSVTADYGVFLELGTRKMVARPFFAPAVDSVAATFPALLAQEINKKVK